MPHRRRRRRPSLRRFALATAAVLAPAGVGHAAVLSVDNVRGAYGFDKVISNGITGAGQTIAIITTYHDPYLQNDLNLFDARFKLPAMTLGANLSQVGPDGGAVPSSNTSGSETALDVEWAHAIAPGANIMVVETTGSFATAARYAATVPGVSVVSISYGQGEFKGEAAYDNVYTTPAGHKGVTFVAAAGDNAAPLYAAASPNVLAVGGTTLTMGANNTYGGEVAWNHGGGGVSPYEPQPGYQKVAGTYAGRVTPDVAYDASYDGAFQTVIAGVLSYSWGTSGGTPQWAGLVALANQQRAINGFDPLTGGQTSDLLYRLYGTRSYADAFHDVTTGTNTAGLSADAGFDAVTGLGTPRADWLVPYLGGSKAVPITVNVPEPAGLAVAIAAGVGRRRRRRA